MNGAPKRIAPTLIQPVFHVCPDSSHLSYYVLVSPYSVSSLLACFWAKNKKGRNSCDPPVSRPREAESGDPFPTSIEHNLRPPPEPRPGLPPVVTVSGDKSELFSTCNLIALASSALHLIDQGAYTPFPPGTMCLPDWPAYAGNLVCLLTYFFNLLEYHLL